MATLTNTKIKDTYDGLLKTTTNDVLGASGVTLIEDGLGNASAISIGRANNGVTITGALTAAGYTYPTSGGTAGQAIVTDGAGNLSFATVTSPTPTLQQVTTAGETTTDSITVGGLTASGLIYPSTDGTSGQVIGTDGAGNLSFIDGGAGTTPTLEDVVTSAAGANTSSINLVIAGANLGTITNDSNTLFGERALASHTSGSYNTAIGWEALTSYTGGSDNTAIGSEALHNLNTGANNTAVGVDALRGGTSLNSNTAIGNRALLAVSGDSNVALGYRAGELRLGGAGKSAGDNNVYIGSNTISALADTDNEIVIGANAIGNGSNTATYGDSNVIGHYFGADLYVNDITIGRGSNSILTNTALGEGALSSSVLSGANNVAVGYFAGDDLTTGTRNVFVGSLAAQFLDGNDNVAIGQGVANYVAGGGGDKTSGTQNVYVGTGIFSGAAYTINEMVFGYGASGNGSHTATYGNDSITDHIFTSGDVGIGTSPSYKLHTLLAAGSSNGVGLLNTSGQGLKIYTDSTASNADVYIEQGATGAAMIFRQSTSERMRIDSSGNVGIGEQSPLAGMDSGYRGIEINGTYPVVKLSNGATDFSTFEADANATYITSSGARYLAMFTNGSERMRIDSSGNIGVGKSNPSGGYGKQLWVSSTTGGQPEGQFYLEGNRSLVGQNVGAISFFNNGSPISGISGMTDSPNISNSGLLRFFTFNNGTESERMRITGGGQVCINRTSGSGSFNVDGSIYLYNFTASSGIYTVKYNPVGGLLSYDTSSARYKHNIRESKYGLSDVLKIESKTFEYNDTNRTDIGFIAEQVYEVIPELVALDKENRPDAVSYDRFTSILVKAIQEQQDIINDLKARIETLEAK